jgi:hypothetical protein
MVAIHESPSGLLGCDDFASMTAPAEGADRPGPASQVHTGAATPPGGSPSATSQCPLAASSMTESKGLPDPARKGAPRWA